MVNNSSNVMICKPDNSFIGSVAQTFSRSQEAEIRQAIVEELSLDMEDELNAEAVGITQEDFEGIVKEILDRSDRYRKKYQMTIELSGEMATRRIWLFGKEIFPEESLKLGKYGFDFSWGYMGGGPRQLALAICLELMGREKALEVYHDFNTRYIEKLPRTDFKVDLKIDY